MAWAAFRLAEFTVLLIWRVYPAVVEACGRIVKGATCSVWEASRVYYYFNTFI